MNFAGMDDDEFRRAWPNLSVDDVRALPDEDRRAYVERFNNLNPWSRKSNARAVRAPAPIDDYDPGEVPPDLPDTETQKSNLIDWAALTGDPPPFSWIMEHWLSWHTTLLAGRGGIGKSLLIQQIATQLATGNKTWCAAGEPLRVLYWACEDDKDQLWRRQTAICKQMRIPFTELSNLCVDARSGLENTLLSSEYGKPMWTPQIEFLRQQVNDLHIDVLALDNLGHTFGANENNRHDVTMFLNGISGLIVGRPFCPVVLGHPSKAPDSQFSGSTAWENAVRMRWYLDDKMPDSKADEDATPDPDYRVLSKKKANYTVKDFVTFHFSEGTLVSDIQHVGDPGIVASLRRRKAKSVIATAIKNLAAKEVWLSDYIGRNYLPSVVLQYKLADGLTKAELADAMRAMILSGELTREVVGKNAARKPVMGLKMALSI